jgi:hypothetical protein
MYFHQQVSFEPLASFDRAKMYRRDRKTAFAEGETASTQKTPMKF